MSARSAVHAVAIAAMALACRGRAPEPGASAGATESASAPTDRPADSLVGTAPGGAEIWLTLGRPDSGESGRCVDRAIEIRHGDTRIPVPLLYTGTPPEIINDTTFRARLSSHCRPGDPYLVDLRTGRPVRERP
jgi:hypothetical protein